MKPLSEISLPLNENCANVKNLFLTSCRKKDHWLTLFTGLTVAICLGVLVFGLRPKGLRWRNNVERIDGDIGLRFGQYGIAYTERSFKPFSGNPKHAPEISIEIALQAATSNRDRFNVILLLHNGEDATQLLVGQWRSHLIVMNGDDYDGKRGLKRIGVRHAFPVHDERFIAITSGSGGTKIYLDGNLAGTNKDLILKIPNTDSPARLVVGNSVYGHHSWTGDIYGLAIYNKERSAQEVEQAYQHWLKQRKFAFPPQEGLVALYRFNEGTGQSVLDRAGEHHLQIPLHSIFLKRKILRPIWNEHQWDRAFFFDVVINIMGFIPFGFCLTAWLRLAGKYRDRSCSILAVLICSSISLLIEVAQAWMPSRSSQMLDLLLNISGAWIGAILYRFVVVLRPGKQIFHFNGQ